MWLKKDDKFKRPKGIVNCKLYTNDLEVSKTYEGRLFAQLWDTCLTEYRREHSYMAELANLDFAHNIAKNSVNLFWSGYNTSLPNFV